MIDKRSLAWLIAHAQSPLEARLGSALFQADWLTDHIHVGGLPGEPETPTAVIIWPQAPLGRFFADFRVDVRAADRLVSCFVECDGREFHSSAEQVSRDRARDAFFRRHGPVFRFTGSRVFRDAAGCAKRVAQAMNGPLYDWAAA